MMCCARGGFWRRCTTEKGVTRPAVKQPSALNTVCLFHRQNRTDILFELVECFAAQFEGMYEWIQTAVADNPEYELITAEAAGFLAAGFESLPDRKCPANLVSSSGSSMPGSAW